ncbi:MAG: RidA family protein [Crocinitomicaceae bacterium]|jgi:2-iminobutanoate/2-iminopropanoate deaminase|nr:RidA family protein [Crocinitomicaceae bacterium]MBT6515914.1 RidA family protein [Crocinitomicaceae bacterium]
MKKTIIETRNAPSPIGPYSQAVACNGMLYLSGQIALNPETDELVTSSIEAETKQVMENINAILLEAGCSLNSVVKCSIFISDMGNFNKINAVYGAYFTNNAPARECVEVSVLPKNVNVEITAIAALP